MTTIEQILGEFIDAWKAGERPDVEAYLARAPAEGRDELASQLAAWLELAPTPEYDDSARTAIAAEPLLQAALIASESLRTPLSARLPTLRERAGLGVREVARRVVAVFDLEDEDRAVAHLERLERGELDAGRLSKRLLSALAAILGTEPEQLAPAPAGGGQAFFRADPDADEWIAGDIDALSRAAMAPAPAAAGPPAAPLDELDRLFLGGPNG